jgi:hypothetical protein
MPVNQHDDLDVRKRESHMYVPAERDLLSRGGAGHAPWRNPGCKGLFTLHDGVQPFRFDGYCQKRTELHTIERLVRAFEEANPEIGVEVRWDRKSKPLESVESGVADIGVAGQAYAGLTAVAIAWDGIAGLSTRPIL